MNSRLAPLSALALSLSLALPAATALADQPAKGQPGAKQPGDKASAPASKSGRGKHNVVKLAAGFDAPAIKIDNWVKGSEIKSFDKGRVYVVEFWATWCAPCKASIPHLTKLQRDFKNDVTVIGVAASEVPTPAKGQKPQDNRLETLQQFVKSKGSQMEYTVAFDGDKEMYRDWMAAAGRGTIPSVFIVGADGKVAWIGSGTDENVVQQQVVAAVNRAKKNEPTPAPKDNTTSDKPGKDGTSEKNADPEDKAAQPGTKPDTKDLKKPRTDPAKKK